MKGRQGRYAVVLEARGVAGDAVGKGGLGSRGDTGPTAWIPGLRSTLRGRGGGEEERTLRRVKTQKTQDQRRNREMYSSGA